MPRMCPALCPVRVRSSQRSPWVSPFPPRTPPSGLRLCSPASQVLWRHPTPTERTCRASALPSPTVPRRHSAGEFRGSPGSRAWSFHACSLFCDSATPKEQLAIYAVLHVAFPTKPQGRHVELVISELNTRPTCASVNASPRTLPPSAHDSRPEWLARPSPYDSFIRYSMPVYPGAFGLPRAWRRPRPIAAWACPALGAAPDR